MKNREKYAEEIKNYDGMDYCNNFILPIILKREDCIGMSCGKCATLIALWLEEEYEEPEVDWSKIAVDTPILVRDFETSNWLKSYFAKFESGKVYAWCGGRTSWNSNDKTDGWRYAKLAEQEESDE